MLQIIKNEWRFLVRSRIFLGISIAFISILMLSVFFRKLSSTQTRTDV